MSEQQPTVPLLYGASAEFASRHTAIEHLQPVRSTRSPSPPRDGPMHTIRRRSSLAMQASRHELSDPEQRIVQELVDEHVHVSCYLVPIDDETWAIRGSIAVDGDVIVAEFDNRADAESALEQLAAAEQGTVTH